MLNYRITDFNFEVIVYRSKVRAINVSNAISNNMPTIEHKGIKISENISKASYAKLSYQKYDHMASKAFTLNRVTGCQLMKEYWQFSGTTE